MNKAPKQTNSITRNRQEIVNQKTVPDKKKSLLLPLFIVFCIPVLLYLQTVSFGLTNFDDDGIISNNITFISQLRNIPKAFTIDAYLGKTCEFYRPLQTVSYMFDVHFSNTTALWMFHLTNVLLFGFIACFLFFVLLRFSIPPTLALVCSVAYCVNPLFTSSVAWIPARGDLLLTMFSLLTLIFFIDFIKTGKITYMILHWLTFTIALFSKETAAFLPFLLLLYFLVFTNNKLFDTKNIMTVILYALSGFFWFCIRSKAIGDVSDRSDQFQVGIFALLNNLKSIPEAFTGFIFPINIAVIPGFSVIKEIIGIVILGFIIFLLLKNKERKLGEKLFGLFWFFLLLIPTMFFRHLFIDYLNHRFLLPFIGILLLLLFIVPKQWMQEKQGIITKCIIVLCIILGIITAKNISHYASPSAFYDAAIDENPQSGLAYNNRGNLKFMDKSYQAALEDFTHAAATNNTIAETYLNIGLTQFNLNNFQEAIINFDKYITYRPNKPETYVNKGMALGSLGDFDGSIKNFTKAISLDPQLWGAYGNRAIARFQIKDYKGAIADCEKVLQLNPNDPKAMDIKAKAQQELQNNKE